MYRVRSWVEQQIFVATLNISELHHPKCAVLNTINNFGEIVSSLLTTIAGEARTKAGKAYYYYNYLIMIWISHDDKT